MANEKYGIELEMDTGDAERKLEELERRIAALGGAFNVSGSVGSGGKGGSGGGGGSSWRGAEGDQGTLLRKITTTLDYLVRVSSVVGNAILPRTFGSMKAMEDYHGARQDTKDQLGLAGIHANDSDKTRAEVQRMDERNLFLRQQMNMANTNVGIAQDAGIGKPKELIGLPLDIITDLSDVIWQLKDAIMTSKPTDPVTGDRK